MHYQIVNDENRVRKTFAYDTSEYTLLYDGNMNTERQAWKWEHNIGKAGIDNRPYYYDYLVTIESDKPINIFEKHVIAVSSVLYDDVKNVFFGTGVVLPVLPQNEMMSTGGPAGFYTDMLVTTYAGVPQLAGAIDANLLAFYTDETLFFSTFAHYNSEYFDPLLLEPFGDDLVTFLRDAGEPVVFSLANRFVGDFFALRCYGAGLSLFLSTYEEDTNVRIKVYRKEIALMTVIEHEGEP